MAKKCPVCQSPYPSGANFCALCGRPLVPARASHASRNAKLLLATIISALITYAVFATVLPGVKTEGRSFDLDPAKAAAVFEILRPQDVKVIVRRDGGRIKIEGTAKECDAVADFAGLITRCCSPSGCEAGQCVERARKTWVTRESYKLPKSKAKTLYDTLAPDDVPVLVSWKGQRVNVDASPQDQETIRRVVDILRGRRP